MAAAKYVLPRSARHRLKEQLRTVVLERVGAAESSLLEDPLPQDLWHQRRPPDPWQPYVFGALPGVLFC